MNQNNTVPQGMRAAPRMSSRLPTEVFSNHFTNPVVVECSDLSMSGMFLSADLLLGAGERLTLSFVVPGTAHRIVTDARIVRSPREAPHGMGVRFDRLSTLDTGILTRSISRALS